LERDAQKFVGYNPENLKYRVEIPLRKNFQRGCKGVCLVTQHGWVKYGKTNDATDGSKNADREDVQLIVGPGRLAVIVMTHSLGKLGTQLWVGEIRLFEDVHGFGWRRNK
jgi:hypothetical protein